MGRHRLCGTASVGGPVSHENVTVTGMQDIEGKAVIEVEGHRWSQTFTRERMSEALRDAADYMVLREEDETIRRIFARRRKS